uniref:RNase III domain-containing protein n=1 Tax=viral metagenome TaxID=1070528 RepID=A0A6C0BLJ2_9ZZZZ
MLSIVLPSSLHGNKHIQGAMEIIDDLSERAKDILKFRGTILNDIPNEFIYVAFIGRDASSRLHPDIVTRLMEVTGYSDYEALEFLGDSVYELVMSEELLRHSKTADQAAILGNSARSNKLMASMMRSVHLCDDLVDEKKCADRFEAIIGALYLFLESRGLDSIQVIGSWLNSIWKLNQIYRDTFNVRRIHDYLV